MDPIASAAASREKKVQFKFEEEVEAFYSDGWWEGAIIAEHSGGKFAVFLRGFEEQIVFEEKDLRLPVQWVKGKGSRDSNREDIRACNIRPCPPEIIVVDGFKVWDEVDAYYNEGWWVGVIAKRKRKGSPIWISSLCPR
ncbi:unnamed protein product [Linum tenue]|uniref:Agenet domain-containing protein n=1 Tax=Linum tenue TaxID=586396 RepID=A0AAV0NX05_9ROSI|nr:unnamed protein product [Linum tenue]